MGEILIGIGTKIVEQLVDPVLDRARYLFGFKQFIKAFKDATAELKTRLDEVKERKEEVARRSEEIMLPVKNWLKNVEKILEDVQELQRKAEGEEKSCFNVSHRYSLAKQMDNMAKQMMQLRKNSHFEKDHFSRLIPLSDITNLSSKHFVNFNSRKATYDSLMEAVKDGKNKMIGLYGMGGSGKTTLANEVGNELRNLKLFEKVAFVVVSKPPDIVKLQQEIAEQIGLKFPEQDKSARARRLSDSLKTIKILIILDDVWECLSLEHVGIPLLEGCRIVLTTRLRNVCVTMDCDATIELPLITKDEAWELFKKHANLYNDHSNKFYDVGRKIVDECKELPIAIVVVGTSLKKKPIEVWESALRRLKHSQPLDVEPGLKSPYACLELSYNNLPSSTAKSLFLFCSMFPEDHEIHKEDLIRFGKRTLELEKGINTMEDVRREILVARHILLNSCLLMSIDKQASVKMHDLVRDVALWIANKQHQVNLVNNYQSLKDTKTLSLWNLEENFKLPNQLHCPTLDTLLIQPHGFIEDFAGINAVKVLALITYSFNWDLREDINLDCSLSISITSLTSLRTLCLRGKILGDISFLGELKGLEVLDLRGSAFNELPVEIENMKMLKLLDLFACKIEKSYLEVIGRCEQLEELYLADQISTIPENFSLPRLKRYVISTCNDFDNWENQTSNYYLDSLNSLDGGNDEMRALWIQGFKVSTLNSSMTNLIHTANDLYLDNCGWWDQKDINLFEIKHLGVFRCQDKKFIIDNLDVDIHQTQVFSHLITLRLVAMNNLEQVFNDSCISYSLPMLEELHIKDCPKLRTCILTPKLRAVEIVGCHMVKWLFPHFLASHCPLLEEIIIHSCSEFEKLIDEEAAHGDPQLKDTHPHKPFIFFPKLKRIQVWGCNKVRRLLPYSLASHCPSLEEISIAHCSEFEGLIDEEAAHGDPLLNDPQNYPCKPFIFFPKLERIDIQFCNKVRWLLPCSLASHFPSLEVIIIGTCSKFEGLIDEEAVHGDPLLHDPHNYPCKPFIFFPKLKSIYIWICNKVRRLLPYSLASHCPSLKEIVIRKCPGFEGLIDEEAVHGDPLLNDPQNFPYKPFIFFPKLERIEIENCSKVRWPLLCSQLASHCPSLETLHIRYLSKLERLVDGESDEEVAYGNQLLLKLKRLSLKFLPKLREVFGYAHKVESLHDKPESSQQKHENERVRVVDSELLYILLDGLSELEYIWKSPTQIVSFHKLKGVVLWECSRLRNIFTIATMTSLPELRDLEIRRCNEWEGIFCEESLENLYATTTVCFPKLEAIHISDCQKVRRLFSYSLASHCPSLKKIFIKDCSQLEGVVQAYEVEAVTHDATLFPRLNNLNLERLPKLREIYAGYEFTYLSATVNIKGRPNICNIQLENKVSSDDEQ